MNRQQRRANRKEAHLGMVNLNEVTMPPQMTTAECAMMAEDRITMNYLQTKHPYHHLTANGVIVEPDPTLDYYLQRLAQDAQYQVRLADIRRDAERLIAKAMDVPKAVPVNRKFYGHDPYEQH